MRSTISDLLNSVAVASNQRSPEEAITTCLTEVCRYTGWELARPLGLSEGRPGRAPRLPGRRDEPTDPFPPAGTEAQFRFLDGDFRILRPGAFVRCAVTGAPIPLDELRSWSVDLQEAYSSPAAAMAGSSGGTSETRRAALRQECSDQDAANARWRRAAVDTARGREMMAAGFGR